jgi:phosphohistidine phosphatase
MLRLYVMRHAKSSWATPGARDYDRELNDRGHSDLVKIRYALKDRKYAPQSIICSSAERTRQTLDGILAAFPDQPEIQYTEKLYSSGMDDYMALISSQTSGNSLMIIGHNPMCGSLADALVSNGHEEHREIISYKYPTSTISVIDFDISGWDELKLASGSLVECLIPSQL